MTPIYQCPKCKWEGPLDELVIKYVPHPFSEDVIPEPSCPVCGEHALELKRVEICPN
jgi:predicted RNA-binding Zn-ribbon protein involved in translation (DUF1610 family)